VVDQRIRRIEPDDVPAVVRLVEEFAGYERLSDQFRLRAEQLDAALFGRRPALFGHVAEVDGEVGGYALWYLTFSTFDGAHGIYLEDLYVRASLRGRGLGTAMLATLARECIDHGYTRLEWSVLDWNAPAIAFYRALGAVAMDAWDRYRLTGDALQALA
jgi:GNAT superfamily N-acetyltransferase